MRSMPNMRPRRLAAAAAHQPGEAQDLAPMQLEVDAAQRGLHVQVPHLE